MSTQIAPETDNVIDFDNSSTAQGVVLGRLSVPMDYSRPEDGDISLAVSWRPASNGNRSSGTVVLLDGGPGGDGGFGVNLPRRMAELPYLAENFDLVGIDLRGRGSSTLLATTPLKSSLPVISRPSKQVFGLMAEEMREREVLCAAQGGDFRAHVTTRNSARDIDMVRRALGLDEISIVGWAYGAYLAGVYGTMFGNHLDKVVFDSPPHPGLSWQGRFEAQVKTIEDNVADWSRWLQGGERCDVSSEKGVTGRRKIDRIADYLRTIDATGGLLTAFDVQVGLLTAEERSWPRLANFADTLISASEDDDSAAVRELLSSHSDWRPSNVEARLHEAVLEAITTETPWSNNLDEYYSKMEYAIANAPFGFGIMRVQPWVGTFRESAPIEDVEPLSGKLYGGGLVIHGDRDTLAPKENGRAMAEATQSSLISILGTGLHGIFGFHDIPELSTKVVSYLRGHGAPECCEIDLRVNVDPNEGRL